MRILLARWLLSLGFIQCLADACVLRLMEEGSVVMTIGVHVDTIFAVGENARCDQFRKELGQMVPVKNLGELRWYSGCFYERDWDKGVLKISQQTFAQQLADEYGIEFGESVPLSVCTRLAEFDKS